MPLQFNQTKRQLSWKIGGVEFKCKPWDSVDVPSHLVEPSKKRGIPILGTPVAPEVRAARRVEDEALAASDSAFAAVKKRAEEAEASLRSAQGEVDRMQAKLDEQSSQLLKAEASIADLEKLLAVANSDKEAAETLLSETAKAAADAEERAQKAEALLSEKKASAKKQPKGD